MCVRFTQLCLTLCNPSDCSPPGSSVHGILQARILEWVVIPFSRESSQTRDQTRSPTMQADSLLSEPSANFSFCIYEIEYQYPYTRIIVTLLKYRSINTQHILNLQHMPVFLSLLFMITLIVRLDESLQMPPSLLVL